MNMQLFQVKNASSNMAGRRRKAMDLKHAKPTPKKAISKLCLSIYAKPTRKKAF